MSIIGGIMVVLSVHEGSLSSVSRFLHSLNHQRLVFLVFCLSLILRLLNLHLSEDNPLLYYPVLDEAYYIELGKAIASGHWLGEERSFFMDPLYGYLLGAVFGVFGEDLLVVRLFQVLLDSVNAVLIYTLGARIWSRGAGLLGSLVYALYKVAFFHTLLILKTTLTVTMPLLFLLLLLRTAERPQLIKWFLLGTLASVIGFLWASLLLLAPLGLFAYVCLERPRCSALCLQVIVFAGGMMALLTLGALRTYHVSGEVIFLNTQGGRLLYASNNPENLTGRYNVPSFSRPHPEESEEDFHREAERRLGRPLRPKEVSDYWTMETMRFLWRTPKAIPSLLKNKILGVIGDYEIPTNHSYYLASRFSELMKWPLPTFAFVLALGLPGLALAGFGRKEVLWLFVPLLTVLITILVFYASSRFRMPAVPFLALGCGISLATLGKWVRSGKLMKTSGLILTAGLVYLISITTPVPVPNGTEEFYLAKAYWSQHRFEEARSVASEAAVDFPGQARFQTLLGMISLGEDRTDEAIQHNLKAIQLEPGHADAYHNLGLAYLLSGRPKEAIDATETALSFSLNPRYLFTLAKAHDGVGDREKAMKLYGDYLRLSKPSDPYRKDASESLSRLALHYGPSR